MDFFMADQLQRAKSNLSSLSSRVSSFSTRSARLMGAERIRAIESLARMTDEAHVSGPLSSVLRNDASLRSKCNLINRTIEEKLGELLDGVEDEVQLQRVFQSLRGRFPRLAREVQDRASRLRAKRVADKAQLGDLPETE